MSTYRLWPSTDGGAATAYSGNFISGVMFAVKGGGNWLEGYWWWVAASGQSTAAVKCALWCVTGVGAGTLVSGSVVTSGTLTAGQWNYIPLATPIQLAPSFDPGTSTNGGGYIAAIGVNGSFPDTNNYWGSGDTGASGIVSGPLVAYSAQSASLPAPYSMAQGVYSSGGTDPSVTMPANASGTDNFWVDVQISDTAPPSYSGSYRLWPAKTDSNAATGLDSAFNYDICVEVHLTRACVLNRMWTYSKSGSASLPTKASVWSISSGLAVASISSPTWSGAAGSGWVSADFAAAATLPAGSYRAGVYNATGTGGQWGSTDNATDYWGAGAGSAGITNGPLYAPQISAASTCYNYNSADGSATPPYSDGTTRPGQSVFGQLPSGGDTFPQLVAYGPGNISQNYWVDLEVTPLSSGLLMASGII